MPKSMATNWTNLGMSAFVVQRNQSAEIEIAGDARALATYTSLRYIDSDNDKTHMIQVGRSQACTRTALELDQQ